MAIEIEAYIEKTEDGGYEFYDRIGAVVVHVDGCVVKGDASAVRLERVSEATEFRGPLYAVTISDNTPVSVQSWAIQSIRSGAAVELLEDDNLDT